MKNNSHNKFSHENMPVGMLIHHASHMHMARIRQTLEGYGVQKTYGPILKKLLECEGITQTELAGNMRITAPSMSVNLQKMETAGLLIRKIDIADMRQVRLYLTEKGREIAERADCEIARLDEALIKDLSEKERTELKRLLIKIINDFTDYSGEPNEPKENFADESKGGAEYECGKPKQNK